MGCSVSSAERALALACAALACVACAACSATPILKIDQEMSAIDLEACVEGVDPCVRSGGATTEQALLPDGAHEVLLPTLASIDAPLNQPSATARRFAYLALGLNNRDDGKGTLEVSIVGDDSTKVVIQPQPGFGRLELDMREIAPPQGARLRLRAVTGSFDVTYAVGRWFVP